MNTELPTEGRRVVRRYKAEDRERLMREQAESGMTRKAFCADRGIHFSTFQDWHKKRKKALLAHFAEVSVKRKAAPVEIELPGGGRIGIHINDAQFMGKLIRGVLSC